MITGYRTCGAARLRVRQCTALPVEMRARTREIHELEVPHDKQHQGYATSLMHKVCREADKQNIVLVLYPQPFGDNIALSRRQLIEWYEGRFGFQCIQAEPVLMARLPGATPRLLQLQPTMAAAAALMKAKT